MAFGMTGLQLGIRHDAKDRDPSVFNFLAPNVLP